MRIRHLPHRPCVFNTVPVHGLVGLLVVLSVALPLSLRPSIAVCQEAADVSPDSVHQRSLFVLPEVTVVATRGRSEALDAPAHIVRVQRPDPTESLGAVLRATGLIHIRSYGITGLSNASVRGGGSSQVAIILDGFALTNAQLGQFDLSLMPSSAIETIEFMPGGASALYGSSAMSGSIRMSSPEVGSDKLTFMASGGAFGERAVEVSGHASLGNLGVVVGARDMRIDGDYRFNNAALVPTRRTRRENADRHDRAGNLSVRLSRGATDFSAAVLAVAAERGLPGVAGGQHRGERQADNLLRATVRARHHTSTARVEFGVLGERSRLDYENPILDVDQSGMIRRFGLQASGEHTISPRLSATAYADFDLSAASHPSLPSDAQYASHSLAMTAVSQLARYSVFPAVRFDRYVVPGRSPSVVLSPRLGVSRRLRTGGPVSLKWSMGRAYRMPTLNDLFWVGGDAQGTRDLRPERSVSTEAGAAWMGSRARAEVSAFVRRATDTISWLPDRNGTWRPDNLGVVAAKGIQVSALARARIQSLNMTGTAGYTFVHARERTVTGADAYIRYAPAHEGHVTIRSRHASGLFVSADLHGAGRRYVATDGSESLPPYFSADVSIGFGTSVGRVEQTVRLDWQNVGNHQYAIVQGYPVPPRHVRLHASITIR